MSGTLSLAPFSNHFLSPDNRLSPGTTGAAAADASSSFLKFSRSDRRRCRASVRAFTVTERPRAAGSFYEVLRVKHNASQTEIKAAYRTLAKLYHPDASYSADSVSDGLDFIEIHNAYATLSDPSARATYDLSLGAYFPRSSSSSSFGFNPTRRWETDQCW
ncbi:Terminal organelle assembly protein [Parasponia andersonii]|uniref:Terminal organelle assembly protein n=1 Tax=Parasponia andersonii TaxID=3476 RepID=A0A2P5BEL0_PARAD|nr:Terminal organelle assembly protein [Parasponia andersonii]